MTGATVTFHGIGEPERTLTAEEREVWVEDLDVVKGMLDVLAAEAGARITFDDGNVSDVRHALPLLLERGLTATFFLLPGFFGRPGFVAEDEVRELVAAGMDVGSHGMLHRPWRRLPEEQVRAEFVESRLILSEVCGRDVDEAACPFGAYDRRALAHAREAGYRRVYTSDGGPALGAWLEPRTSIRQADTADELRRRLTESPSIGTMATRRAKRLVKRWR